MQDSGSHHQLGDEEPVHGCESQSTRKSSWCLLKRRFDRCGTPDATTTCSNLPVSSWKNVRCRLERGSLVIDGKGYFSLESVRRAVRALIADYPPSVQPCILEEFDRYKRTSRSPVSTSATPTRRLSTTEQSGSAIHQD